MKKKYLIMSISVLILVALDYISKALATEYLKPLNEAVPLFPGLELVYVLNDGSAFSLFSGQRILLIVAPILTVLFLVYLLITKKISGLLTEICVVLVISGGIGNLIDRIATGVVVDFFNFTFMNFAVFNVADCYVTVGVTIYAIFFILEEIKLARSAKKDTEVEEENSEQT